MRHDMFAASGVKHLALFDPGALGDPLELSKEDFDPRLRGLAETSRMALLHVPRGDCEASLALFVEEDPPDWLLKAGKRVEERCFRLEVPSGKIEAAGAEDLFRPHSEREPGSYSQVAIPPALYNGTVYTTTVWKARNRSRFLAQRSTAWSRRFAAFETVSGVLLAALFVFHLIAFAPVVGLSFKRSMRAGLIALAVVICIDLIALAVLKGSAFLSKRFPALRAAREASEEFEAKYPDILIRLSTPLPGSVEAPSQNVLEVSF
jgi:hypothetical protein